MKKAITLIDISPRMNSKKIYAPKGVEIIIHNEYQGADGAFSLCEYNKERFFTNNNNFKIKSL